ncbi:MAG: nucleoside-diphosphate sugar epimerase [Arenimonas sp.]|nr:nucleoside-diphosphate sugar epimerase [Arenimonas sp.]
MSRILVVGLSGQFRHALLPRLLGRGDPILALSRTRQPPEMGVEWVLGSLQAMPVIPADIATIISLGPLDAFADWFDASGPDGSRVIALGSTGRTDKLDSIDPAERELAQRLRMAEARLLEAGGRRGAVVTVLRPTLLYGSGRDLTLSWLVELGRRWGCVVLPASATGLRQPVHVADVADAILRCLDEANTAGRTYDLPGGEVLGFDEMVRRSIARHAPGCRVLCLPTPLFKAGLGLAGLLRRAPIKPGLLARLERDQLADAGPAREAFGYSPRGFEP